ncbi:IBR finger domain protein, partial [Metarhizium hybridum]
MSFGWRMIEVGSDVPPAASWWSSVLAVITLRVAVALNFVTFVERGGRLVLVNNGMKTGYWIVPLLLLIEMRGTDWTMRSELSEWNKNSRTCEIIMNADMRLGGTVRALFSARNVRISFLSTFTNASTVESWLAEHADATDFE